MADSSSRRYERIDIQLRCRLFIPEPQEGKKPARLRFEAFATSHNLGLGGLFVESAFLLKPNVQLSVELHLPNGPLPIWSRVAHVIAPGQNEHPTGMGIEFLDVDSHGRETLLRYFTPTAYEQFYRSMLGDFPHLKDDFALEDVSLLVNLWEEAKAKGVAPKPAAAADQQRRRPTRGRG
jgi:hypothetical protein